MTFKVESHNHPSYVEPYQGAATGVGGIVRDIMSMGARPVAVMDPLRFGPADAEDTRRVLPGVVAGIGGYGNCLGLPNIGGEVVFDPSYAGNPLVNALCVGVMRHEEIKLAHASGAGNLVVLFGAATGGDGIGGVSVLASETFDDAKPSKRPAVQVGDPFMEKVLIECCLDIFAADLVVGIQDLGGAGLSCATSELASNGDGGMRVWLDRVPLRDASLRPEEILMSESQERMCAVVEPAKLDAFLEVCERWDVLATVIGEVDDTGRLTVEWHGETVVDVPPRTVAHEGPVYERPYARPSWQDALQADDAVAAALGPATGDELRATLLRPGGRAEPRVEVVGHRPVRPLRPRQHRARAARGRRRGPGRRRRRGLGVAIATDGNGRFAKLDPYAGAQLALSEAYRNVAVTGAKPLAVTDCLNFGSPEDPDVMWQFAEATRGLADACLELGLPVTGGNVSFYNQTGDRRDQPDAGRRRARRHRRRAARVRRSGFAGAGRGRAAARRDARRARRLGVGAPRARPPRRPPAGRGPGGRAGPRRADGSRLTGLVTAAHDVSDGGLAQTLVEMALRRGRRRDGDARRATPFVALFSESVARAVVTVPADRVADLESAASTYGVPVTRLGTTGGESLAVQGLFEVGLDELRTAHDGTLPALFA